MEGPRTPDHRGTHAARPRSVLPAPSPGRVPFGSSRWVLGSGGCCARLQAPCSPCACAGVCRRVRVCLHTSVCAGRPVCVRRCARTGIAVHPLVYTSTFKMRGKSRRRGRPDPGAHPQPRPVARTHRTQPQHGASTRPLAPERETTPVSPRTAQGDPLQTPLPAHPCHNCPGLSSQLPTCISPLPDVLQEGF